MDSFSSFLAQIGGRFLLAAVPPAFVLVAGEAVLAKLMVDPEVESGALLAFVSTSLLGGLSFWITVLLIALGFLLTNRLIVQIWEGYPFRELKVLWRGLWRRPAPASREVAWLALAEKLGGQELTALHQQRGNTFSLRLALGDLWDKGGLGPPIDSKMPTALGSIFRDMETTPTKRYQINAIHFWSPLLLVAPPALGEQYALNKTWLDLALHLASALILLAMSAAYVLHPASLAAWGAIIVLLLAAYLMYRFSLPFAEGMRLAFEAGFDLYRGDLLKAWGLRQPQLLLDEKRLWMEVQYFQRWGYPYLFPEEYRLRNAPSSPPTPSVSPTEPS